MKTLFTSRKFWVTIFALTVIVVGSFFPSFDLDTETAAGFALVVVAYVIGVSVDPGPGGWKGVILSRKFWTAAVGLVLLLLNAFHITLPFGLTGDMLIEVILVLTSYIVGVAIEGVTQPYKGQGIIYPKRE